MKLTRICLSTVVLSSMLFQTSWAQNSESLRVQSIKRCAEKSVNMQLQIDQIEGQVNTGATLMISGGAVAVGGVTWFASYKFLPVVDAGISTAGIVGVAGAATVMGGVATYYGAPRSESERLSLAKIQYDREQSLAIDLLDGERNSVVAAYLNSCREKLAGNICDLSLIAVSEDLNDGTLCAADYLDALPLSESLRD